MEEEGITYEFVSKNPSKNIDHLGLVAAKFKELKILETIDRLCGPKPPDSHVTTGECVLAMVLHGLGFTNFTLYSTAKYLSLKPIEQLIRAGIQAEWFNDDRLGRALDKIYEVGVTPLFIEVATVAAKQLGLEQSIWGIDSTSFAVHGTKYKNTSKNTETILITRGYSKDRRNDLLQMCLNIISCHLSGIPMLMLPGDGNQSDRKTLSDIVARFSDQLVRPDGTYCIVADSAFYNQKSLRKVSELVKWLSRPPKNLTCIKELIEQLSDDQFEQLPLTSAMNKASYSGVEVCSTYAGIKQRFLVVINHTKAVSAKKLIDKKWEKKSIKVLKRHQKLGKKRFHCSKDAEMAISKEKYVGDYMIEKHTGSVKTAKYDPKDPDACHYKIVICTISDLDEKQKMERKSTRFVIATNELDPSVLSTVGMLENYKGQNRVEQGFRFLKDPLFMANILFLKKEHRIMALLMIMTISLLVYTALEYKIRIRLAQTGTTFPNQLNKEISNPTVRWIFICFTGVHIQYSGNNSPPMVGNLNEIHFRIIHMLGKEYEYCYLLRK